MVTEHWAGGALTERYQNKNPKTYTVLRGGLQTKGRRFQKDKDVRCSETPLQESEVKTKLCADTTGPKGEPSKNEMEATRVLKGRYGMSFCSF